MLRSLFLQRQWTVAWVRLRNYSSARVCELEQVQVVCKSNGHITLDIHRPNNHHYATKTPIIVYLPRGPILQPSKSNTENFGAPRDYVPDSTIAAHLSTVAAATVVQINYRLDKRHPFPTPIYDVLAGYDWIVGNLVPQQPTSHGDRTLNSRFPEESWISRSSSKQAKLCVCGELIGGTLALTLALTECKLSDPARIIAAASNNPIVDWTFGPATQPKPPTFRRNLERPIPLRFPPTTTTLLQTRKLCFPAANPSAYFDPFASPLHFLRTPATDPPSASSHHTDPTDEAFAILANLEAQTPTTSNVEDVTAAPRRRKISRRWPPAGLQAATTMPDLRLSVGAESVLRGQGEEMTRLLRRAWVKYGDVAAGAGDGLVDEVLRGITAGKGEEERRKRGKGEAGRRGGGTGDEEQKAEGGGGGPKRVLEEEVEALRAAVRSKVMLEIGAGSGLWCLKDGSGWAEEELARLGAWFAHVLRSP